MRRACRSYWTRVRPSPHHGPPGRLYCCPGGSYVTLRGFDEDFPADEASANGISFGHLLVEPGHAGLLAITELIEAGLLRPIVDRVLPLDQAAAAHAYGESSHNTGKIVFSVADEGDAEAD